MYHRHFPHGSFSNSKGEGRGGGYSFLSSDFKFDAYCWAPASRRNKESREKDRTILKMERAHKVKLYKHAYTHAATSNI
jgi:hypothetical protein